MDQEEIYRRAVELVDKARGKLEVRCKVGAADLDELSVAYFWGIGVERDIDMAQQVRRSYFYVKNNIWRDVLTLYGFPSI